MIPVNEPLIAKNALKYAGDCIKSGWISSAGEYIRKFEAAFAQYIGVKHAVTTTSGTTALHLALAAAGVGPGDEVILPDLTMIAVPYAVLYTGAKPALVDVDRILFNLDPSKVREFVDNKCRFDQRKKAWVNRRTGGVIRAILPVHLYGHPCPMDEILAISREFGWLVVEDAAEAHGARFHPGGDKKKALKAGALGDIGCFSFYANKIVTTGEGGMVVTNDDALADRCRRLKDLAHASGRRFLHTELAFNYRMTNVQAAIGLAQLEEIDRYIAIKRKMAAAYKKGLAGVRGLTLPEEMTWARSVYWMYAVLVEDEFGLSRDEFAGRLKEAGIDTRTFFVPVHEQPVFTKDRAYTGLSFPVSEELSKKGLYLPSGLALTQAQIEEVCCAIRKIRASI
ncbi:MAG: DegT/DnrJ/EryC1/StrS family aminotransferase [Candidatus Aminicenantes bacterium]|nr:DegT/DnrJ/EryC1/StrS family aminotransferase [Candidatus Aminicenantes bacterium]